jgi:hypothetical protein
MMEAAHNESPVKRIPAAIKCATALQAISRQQTITAIAKEFDCSRTTVHAQKNHAWEAETPIKIGCFHPQNLR